MSHSGPLAALRDSLADIDRALLELLRRRMDLAAEVGRIKAEAGLEVVVRDVEDRVLTRARQQAEACGVSPEVMEGVFKAILQGSVERQYRVGIAMRQKRGERMLIVGGAGGMGSWFRSFFALAGHEVDIVDPAMAGVPAVPGLFSKLADVEDLDRYAAIVVSAPLNRTPEVLSEVVERRPRGAVIEVTSIKSHLVPTLERARELGVRVHALHPMFGPAKSFYETLTFVLAAQGDLQEERAQVEELIRHPFTHLVVVPFPQHDRLMGWLLGLAHLSNLLFGAAVTHSGIDPDDLHNCASATFSRHAANALLVLSSNPDLYLDIQTLNPHRHEVYAAVHEALAAVERLVAEHDREGFQELMSAARHALTREP